MPLWLFVDKMDGQVMRVQIPQSGRFGLARFPDVKHTRPHGIPEGRAPCLYGGQIQGLSQAAIAEIKRFDPDGVHDAGQIIGEKVPSRRRLCRYAASSLDALKHYGSPF